MRRCVISYVARCMFWLLSRCFCHSLSLPLFLLFFHFLDLTRPFFISHSLSSLDLDKPSFCVIIESADWHTIHSHPSKNKTAILLIYPPRRKWKISSLFLVPVISVKWRWLQYLPALSTVQSIMLVSFKENGIKRRGLQNETI